MTDFLVSREDKTVQNVQVVDPNFLHTIARYVTGNVVDIRTNKNQIIRGVFGGCHQGVNFSIDKPVIIDQSQRISKKLQSPLVLHREDIVEIRATNVDKDEVIQNNMTADSNCVGSGLRTDAEIASDCRSRPNGGDIPDDGINLEPFYAAGSEPKDLDGLELNGEDGWSAKQMFSKNESLGVSSTYDPTLAEYTTELRKEDTEEYREREARASALAAEIESSSESRSMAERENDDDEVDDEETRFSAVQRQSSMPSYQYGRGNGRNLHNDRQMSHFGPRGGGPPVRGGGRGTSYRNAVEGGGMNSGLKSGGANPAHARGTKESLMRFSNNFRLAKSNQAGGPGQSQNVSTNLPPGGGSAPRKAEPGPLKNAGPRTKRVYNQTPPTGQASGVGRSGVKHQDEHFSQGSSETENSVSADSKNDSPATRRGSDADKMRRDETTGASKPKEAEEKPASRSPVDTAPKAQPATPPVSSKRSVTDAETPASTSSEPNTTVPAASATPEADAPRDTSPAASDKSSERKTPAPAEAKSVTVKSSLNADAQPFYPSWHSPTTAPNNAPIQSPPVPTPSMAPPAGGMSLGQPRGVVTGPQHPPVHPTMGVPMTPYQVQAPPSIAAPLQSQPLQASALGHVQAGPGGPEAGSHQNPHAAPTILFHSGARYATLPPGHTVGHHSAVAGPTYPMQHQIPGAHGPVSQGMAMAQHAPAMQAQQPSNHSRNGNGGAPKRSAVVSVQSGGPPGVMNRGANPEAQAAAMTGTPLVAPNPHGAQQVHPPNPHGGPYHTTQRIDWASSYSPYGAVSTAQMAPQAGREGSSAQPGANISNPPTPSSTPQQTPTFLTQPTMSIGHAAQQYVYQQQMSQQPGPHQPLFPHHQNVGSLAHYPHHSQHLAAAASQAIGPNGNAMMAGPPGALMLYQTALPGHPHQATGVSHQPGQHHPQPHHQAQQQQHVPNQVHTHMTTVLHPMYTAQPQHAHMQQHHHQQTHQQQQQHHQAAAALQQVMQQTGGPLQQFQQGAHAHAHAHAHPHAHPIPNLPYAQGPSAAQYMAAQSQHAGHSVPQHAPQ